MKKILIVLAALFAALTVSAQDARSLYTRYSDLPGVQAVYISPAMFRMMGRLPMKDMDLDVKEAVKSLSGFYLLNVTDPDQRMRLKADANRFVQSGKYEMLMEAKDDGQTVRMYSIGDGEYVSSFAMLSEDGEECVFMALEGLISQAAIDRLIEKQMERGETRDLGL